MKNIIFTKKSLLWVFLITAFVSLLYPYFAAISLSLPASDDFSSGWMARAEEYDCLFTRAIILANTFSKSWGGDWINHFLQTLLNPLLVFSSPLDYYGEEMMVFFAVFCAVVVYLLHCVFKHFFGIQSSLIRGFLSVAVLAAFLLAGIHVEVFNWYIGATYSWHLCFAMFCISAAIKNTFAQKSVKNSALMVLFGVLACQSVCYDMMIGATLLTLIITDFKNGNMKCAKSGAVILAILITVGCFAAFSSGNFARFGGTVSEIDIIWSVKHSILVCIFEAVLVLKNGSVIFAL